MAFPLWAIPAGISAATGLMELFGGGNETDEDKDDKELLRNRMRYGDPAAMARLEQALTPGVLRSMTGKQNALARMHAARGTSYSTQADADITSVPGPGEVLPPILADANLRIMMNASQDYFGLKKYLAQKRQASKSAGYGLLGKAAGMAFTGLSPKEEDPLSELLQSLFGGEGNSGGGYYLPVPNNSEFNPLDEFEWGNQSTTPW